MPKKISSTAHSSNAEIDSEKKKISESLVNPQRLPSNELLSVSDLNKDLQLQNVDETGDVNYKWTDNSSSLETSMTNKKSENSDDGENDLELPQT